MLRNIYLIIINILYKIFDSHSLYYVANSCNVSLDLRLGIYLINYNVF